MLETIRAAPESAIRTATGEPVDTSQPFSARVQRAQQEKNQGNPVFYGNQNFYQGGVLTEDQKRTMEVVASGQAGVAVLQAANIYAAASAFAFQSSSLRSDFQSAGFQSPGFSGGFGSSFTANRFSASYAFDQYRLF